MRKLVFIFFFISFTTSFSQIKIKEYKPNLYYLPFKEPDSIFVVKSKKVETNYKGFNYPYIHINDYYGYTITKSNYKNFKDFFELNFFHTYSSFYTRKVMYEKFGNWDSYFKIKGQHKPFLIWKNVELFDNDNRKFTIIGGGYECTTCKEDSNRIYASVFVLDEEGNDVLKKTNSEISKKIIHFFSNGIKNLTNSNVFYAKFYGLAEKRKLKRLDSKK